MAAATDLPLIACFHGSGSNSAIFEIQCWRLQEKLGNDFEFVFFDAPFECPAGPGVLPAFEDEGPFRTWFLKDSDAAYGSGPVYSPKFGYGGDGEGGEDGVSRVRRLMRDKKAAPRRWVGVMGFSQGSRVAAGLLLDQQKRKETSREIQDDGFDLRFGVLCMGGGLPMGPDPQGKEEDQLIRIPTLHLHGLKDSNLEPGRAQLKEGFAPESTTLLEIDYHHAMPWATEDLDKFAEIFKEIAQP